LRDFGNDRVAFRHDVLAEWAVSCLLSDLGVFDRLPLQSAAPAIPARGVELAARFAIERSADSTSWQRVIDLVSREGVHGSWRRAALLALVRSEAAADALTKASEPLLANHARLLRELIRTVKAVDVLPAAQLFVALGVDPASVPPHLYMPHGPAWVRLIMWLLALGDRVPAAAIPDVTSLYFDWSLSIGGRDPVTPLLLPWVHRWLSAIEDARETELAREYRAPFTGDLDGANLSDLEDSLRTTFVSFCDRTPALAASYLEAVMRRRRNERAVEAILKYRGRLADAAPAQLAALTVAALIPPTEDQRGAGRRRGRRRDNEPFSWADSQFIPASPAQGPFLELLTWPMAFEWASRSATSWRSWRKGSHDARLSEEVLSVGRDTSISRAWSDRTGQLRMAGHLQHHDDGLAHDARLLTCVVRLPYLGGEPQLPNSAALEGVRDQSSNPRPR
jgi:hypothetical protein